MHQCQSLALYLFDDYAQDLLLGFLFFWKEYQTCTILPLFWNWNTLKQNKLVGNLYHDTSTITRLVASLSSAMLHVFQHLQCIVHQFVALSAMDIYHHSHTTSVMLVVTLVESFPFYSFHIILTKNLLILQNRAQNYTYCQNNKAFYVPIYLHFGQK